jgi:hypothetical protein
MLMVPLPSLPKSYAHIAVLAVIGMNLNLWLMVIHLIACKQCLDMFRYILLNWAK